MKNFPSFLLAAFCSAMAHVATPVHAATLVVDNQNAKAADTNAGTRAAPFKTIRQM
jgi:hypothetical protein